MIDNVFNIGDIVKINFLGKIQGRVISVWETQYGIKYEVRYFYDGSPKEVYFFGDEIEKIS